MSIADGLMPDYFQYATGWPPERVAEVTEQLASGALHPNAAKRLLARTVVDLYHGDGHGTAAEAEFDRMFKAHAAPEEIPDKPLERSGPRRLSKLLVELGLASSGPGGGPPAQGGRGQDRRRAGRRRSGARRGRDRRAGVPGGEAPFPPGRGCPGLFDSPRAEPLVSSLAPHAGSRLFHGPGTTEPVDTNVLVALVRGLAHSGAECL